MISAISLSTEFSNLGPKLVLGYFIFQSLITEPLGARCGATNSSEFFFMIRLGPSDRLSVRS